MIQQPKLTICVPSRNRQRYFQETIRSLLINLRTDVEFVLADNSDNASIMNDFMADVGGDPRVVFLPSTGSVLSMMDNWERCLEAATGEFVCVIGDDDYVDVDVADLIIRSQVEHPVIDVFVWSRMTFNWPGNRPNHCNVAIPLKTEVHRIPRAWLYQEFFSWRGQRTTPNMAFAIYHGAVSKRILDKMKAKFGGRYFEYPVVDFENVCKLLVTAENLFYSERCFSVLGSCAESNSAKIKVTEKVKEQHAQFMLETGRNIDEDPHMKDFPFPSILGLAACIAQTQHWFRTKYGYKAVDGWEANFAEACGINCGMMDNIEAYETMRAGYEDAFRRWHGGKYLKYFKPVPYLDAKGAKFFVGIADNHLFLDEEIADVQTPAELYHIVEQMLTRQEDLTLNFKQHFKVA